MFPLAMRRHLPVFIVAGVAAILLCCGSLPAKSDSLTDECNRKINTLSSIRLFDPRNLFKAGQWVIGKNTPGKDSGRMVNQSAYLPEQSENVPTPSSKGEPLLNRFNGKFDIEYVFAGASDCHMIDYDFATSGAMVVVSHQGWPNGDRDVFIRSETSGVCIANIDENPQHNNIGHYSAGSSDIYGHCPFINIYLLPDGWPSYAQQLVQDSRLANIVRKSFNKPTSSVEREKLRQIAAERNPLILSFAAGQLATSGGVLPGDLENLFRNRDEMAIALIVAEVLGFTFDRSNMEVTSASLAKIIDQSSSIEQDRGIALGLLCCRENILTMLDRDIANELLPKFRDGNPAMKAKRLADPELRTILHIAGVN